MIDGTRVSVGVVIWFVVNDALHGVFARPKNGHHLVFFGDLENIDQGSDVVVTIMRDKMEPGVRESEQASHCLWMIGWEIDDPGAICGP